MHDTFRRSLAAVLVVGGLVACSSGTDGDGASGATGDGGSTGSGGVAGAGGGRGGAGGTGGAAPPPICILGLCSEDAELASSCQENYDACVGRGHYEWACRMDADEICGVLGQTGPYY